MNAWHNTWNRTMEIATGAPQVISHRVGLMHPATWSPTTSAELQQMVAEKVQAAAESWSVLCQAALSPVLPMQLAANPLDWWGVSYSDSVADHAASVVHQALLPVSRCVSANVDRLKKS